MDNIQAFHLERIKAATLNKLTLKDIPEWLCKNTFINGKAYSFKDHEFQEKILRDTSSEVIIRKCAQVGMSETTARLALAICSLVPHTTVIYTLPTAGFATIFMRSRIDSVIQDSPYLRASIHGATDNSEVKSFSGNSYLYLKGSQSTNSAVSIPASVLIHDEIDFSDEQIISQYQSRLRHAQGYKRTIKLSTPTRPGFGIDAAFDLSRRHFNFVKCEHCNHYFVPDFYKNVRIPGFFGDISTITSALLPNIDWRNAFVECPECAKRPSLQKNHRHWVCENPEESHVAVGYQVTPFDAPNVMTTPSLVEESTKYKKRSDFDNFGLGMPSEDKESVITQEDLNSVIIPYQEVGQASFVMGLDMGSVCWLTIMAVRPNGEKIVVFTQGVAIGEVRARRREIAKRYRVRMTCVDAFPYTETVIAMQAEDMNLYGCVYVQNKTLTTHTVVEKEGDEGRAKLLVRQVNINRNKAFDMLMEEIRNGQIHKISDENDGIWRIHLTDMKRVKEFDKNEDLSYVWKKTKGDDHLHHSLLYASTAAQMLGMSHGMIVLPALGYKFRVKTEV